MPVLHEDGIDLCNSRLRRRHLEPLARELLLPPLLRHNSSKLLLLGTEQVPSVQLENFELGRLLLHDLAFELRVLQPVLDAFDFGQKDILLHFGMRKLGLRDISLHKVDLFPSLAPSSTLLQSLDALDLT